MYDCSNALSSAMPQAHISSHSKLNHSICRVDGDVCILSFGQLEFSTSQNYATFLQRLTQAVRQMNITDV